MLRSSSTAKKKLFSLFSLDRIALVAFIIGAVFIEGSFEYRIVGVALILTFLIQYQNTKAFKTWPFFDNPPEIHAFTLWTIWALGTMMIVSQYPVLIPLRYKVQLQVVIIYWAFYGHLRLKPNLNLVFLTIWGAGIIQGLMAFSGYTEVLEDNMGIDAINIRLGGIGRATNSNALGLLMTRASLCSLFFWRHPKVQSRRYLHFVILVFLLFAGYLIVISGSRKSSLFFAISILGWWGWALPKSRGLQGLISKVFFIVLGLLLLSQILPNVLENTAVGKRWMDIINKGDGTIVGTLEEDSRIYMARLGVEIFKEHPIAGVGLGHYMMYTPIRIMAHNDYIETLSGTGLIGFILYQSMKVILGFRLFRLLVRIEDPAQNYLIKIMILMWIYIVLSGAGFHQYHDYQTIIFFTTLFTYSWIMENKLKQTPLYSRPHF